MKKKRKRKVPFWLPVLLLALLLAALLSACAGQGEALPELVIGVDECRPYIYTDEEGNSAGIDAELAKEACRRMGYTPVFRKIDWNDRDTLLSDGEIDCLWSCYSMDDREADYAWVGPYMYARQVVAVLEKSSITSIEDLEGKTMAVKVSSKPEDIFLKQPGMPRLARLYCLMDMDEVTAALRNDYVDACAGYNATLTELLQNADVAYRTLEEDLDQAALGVAFAKDSDPALRNALTEALAEMYADGTMDQVMESYHINPDRALGRVRHGAR